MTRHFREAGGQPSGSLDRNGEALTRSPRKASGSDRRRNNSQAEIKETAARLFFESGYEATSIRNIVDACGLTPPAFYNHFATKEALLRQIVEDGHATVGAMMGEAVESAGKSATERLRALIVAYVRFHTHHQVLALVANAEYSSLTEPSLSEIRNERVRLRRLFEAIIDDGVRSGEFSLVPVGETLSTRTAAIAIGDMCLRVAEWYRPDGALTRDEVETAYAALGLRMVGWQG
ncbi:TetR/AcrR family transcriptional regulator [Brevundimonas diminuta]|uniref:TetR/AcrR family transcriptional regulator n=1 Tax=Brevundimonas diminuta TaxID=293 RepID=UPI00320B91E9